MNIKKVEVRAVNLPMGGNQRNARRTWTHKQILFCFVHLENGLVGIGEGWTSYGSTRALAATIEDDVAPLVVGRSLDASRDLPQKVRDACVMSGRYGILAVALSAVEIALWDLRAQVAQKPLWQLLGGTNRQVPVYASAGLYAPNKTPGDLGAEMRGYVDAGHRSVKLKVGGATEAEDIARVAAARNAIGADVELLVDAHYTMSETAAISFANAAAPYELGWFEAPMLPTDFGAYARLSAASPIPICGNETLPWREGFELLGKGGATFLMPDVSACGGIEEVMAVGDLAAKTGAQLTLHSSSSLILYVASLHVASAHTATHSVEHHMMHRWFYELGDVCLTEPADGHVTLTEKPGLGINAADLHRSLDRIESLPASA